MPYIGRLGDAGLAKEGTPGTAQTPIRFRRFIPPFNFSTDIAKLIGKGVSGNASEVQRTAQGKAQLKGGKIKSELDLLEVGDDLMAAYGVDTVTEMASFTVVTGTNDTIDWATFSFTLAAGTYKAGQTQADTGSLCQLLYTGMHSADSTVTGVTFTRSATGGTFAISFSGGTPSILWHTGTHTAKSIGPLLGFPVAADSTGANTYTGANVAAGYSHAFTRIQSASLPTYTWWQKTGLDYPQHVGCMLSKLEFAAKAGEFIEVDADWLGLKYDATGVTQTPVYSGLNPLKFNLCIPTVGNSVSTDYDDMKVTIDNSVKVEHAVGATIYGAKIYSEGIKVDVAMSLMVEDLTEWSKFIAGSNSSFSLAMTSTDLIKAGFPLSLTLSIPVLNYKAAPRTLPNGLIKIAFSGAAVNLAGTYEMLPTLVNGYGLPY